MTHYTVKQLNSAIPKLATVSSLEQERFQGTLLLLFQLHNVMHVSYERIKLFTDFMQCSYCKLSCVA